jgi:hypothetical protein
MRKAALALLLLSSLVAAGCGAGSLNAVGAERYLKTEGGLPEAHCLPGSNGWTYVCSVRRGTRAFRVGVLADGKRVKDTSELLPVRGPVPPVPGSAEAKAQGFLDRASAICSRRATIVATIPPPQNVYAAYKLMGAYVVAEREEARSLRLLETPDDRAEAVRRLISAADRAVAASQRYRGALLDQNRREVARALAAQKAAAADEEQAAQELGIRCAAVSPS